MIGEGVVAAAAKVIAVGGLMAAAAGGVYVVTSTNSGDESERVVQLGDTPTVDASPPTPGTPAVEPGTETTTPAPPALREAMLIGGTVWVDGRLFTGTVTAAVSGTFCTSADIVSGPDGGPVFVMHVPPATEVAGCGSLGALVEFSIDDGSLLPQVEFISGVHPPVTFSRGTAFMQIYGNYYVGGDDSRRLLVQPLIDGVVCGVDVSGGYIAGPERGYHVVVDSAEKAPGCGASGALIFLEVFEVIGDAPPTPLKLTIGSVAWDPGGRIGLPTYAGTPTPVPTAAE